MFKSKTTSKSNRNRTQATDRAARAVRSAARGAAAGVFEMLEDRRLFSVLTVDGTAGNDVISVYTSGTDIVVNNNGALSSHAAASVDQVIVNGLAGADRVSGTVGVQKSMTIYGGAGDDSLCGGGANDFLVGGDGNDLLDGCFGADDFSGGLGTDTANYSTWTASVRVSLDDMPNDGAVAELDNVHSDVENVIGGSAGDVLTGSSAANYLQGAGGTDTLRGMDGDDILDGGIGGASPYTRNTGNDTLYGGNGHDTLHASDYGHNRMYGEAGNDHVYGYGGADTLSGGDGADTLFGGSNNDSIYGGLGNDTAYGQAGNDKIFGNGNVPIVFEVMPILTTITPVVLPKIDLAPLASAPGAEAPSLAAPSATLLPIDRIDVIDPIIKFPPIVIVTDDDHLYGGDGEDTIHGNGGNDSISGDAGNDLLYGDAGDDHFLGGTGDDRLYGGAGTDMLCGGFGNDILVDIGGGQNDRLNGDAGFDSFWMDAEATETCDADLAEILSGNVHRVGGFQTLRTVSSGGTVNTQAVSRELNGQSLMDPIGGGTMTSFKGNPLFSSSGPSKNDVRQGGVGDCYFLAGLSATAKTNANRIQQSVVDLGDGTFAVQFFSGGSPRYYRVDADLPASGTTPTYAKLGAGNSMWVAVMEKAFAFHRSNVGTYASINAGWMSEAFNAVGSSSIFESADGNNILNWLKSQLDSGKAVTFATKDMAIPAGIPVVGCHAYMVERVNMQTISLGIFGTISVPVSVTLRNPWGYDGAGSDSDTSDGYVTLTGDQAATVLWKAQAAFV